GYAALGKSTLVPRTARSDTFLKACAALALQSENLLVRLLLVTPHHLPVHHHHLPLLHLHFFPALRHHLAVHHDPRAVGQGCLAIHPGNLLPVLHHRHLAILHHDAILLGGYNGGGKE